MDTKLKRDFLDAFKEVEAKIENGWHFDLTEIESENRNCGCFWGLLSFETDSILSKDRFNEDEYEDLMCLTYMRHERGIPELQKFFPNVETEDDVSNITWEEWKDVVFKRFGLEEEV